MIEFFVLLTKIQKTQFYPQMLKDRKKTPHKKIDETPIRDHINSFRLTTSHYQRKHAPNKLYLSNDLSFPDMSRDFYEKNEDFKISYENSTEPYFS